MKFLVLMSKCIITLSHTVPDSEGIGEDKEKCPTLSPSDDDEDLSDEDVSGTGEFLCQCGCYSNHSVS